jgi:hypothetical protein
MADLQFLALGNFNEVNPYEIWDFCHFDEVPNSTFQLQILLSSVELNQRLSDEYSQFPNTTINTLDKQIMGSLFQKLFYNHSIINTNIKFLEHHYRLTKDKNIFLSDLKNRINPTYYSAYWGDDINSVVNARDILNEVKSWIERKIEQLSHDENLKRNSVSSLKTDQSVISNVSENLFLTTGKIVDLHKLLETEKIIEPIDFSDFLKCFDPNTPPTKHPVILNRSKKLFVYALSFIEGMNSRTALKNFGITNYDKNKSDLKTSPIPKNKRATENKIASLLKQPVKVTSK